MLRHAEKLAGDAGVQTELLQGSIGSVADNFGLGACKAYTSRLLPCILALERLWMPLAQPETVSIH